MKERSLLREIHRCTDGTLRWFNECRLDGINRDLIEQFIVARGEEGAGAAGTNRDLGRLRNLLNDAADRDSFSHVAFPRIPWRKLTRTEKPTSYRAMRDQEEPLLLAAIEDRIVRAVIETLLHTGIRPEACLRLRLGDHVDLEEGKVWVDEELDKNGHGYCTYLNSHLLGVLRGLVAGRPGRLRHPGAELFCYRNGRSRRSVRESWKRACERAGIEWSGPNDKGLKLRGLRPTFKTRIVMAGGAEIDAERLLGHSTRSIANRYYDPDQEHLRSVVELTIRHRPSNVVELRPGQVELGSTQERRLGTLSI